MPLASTFATWRGAFLEALRKSGNVKASALAAGVHPQTAYRARRAHPDFAAEWADAVSAWRAQALPGETRPGAIPVAHPGEAVVTGAAGSARAVRLSPHRFGKTARKTFLTELGATGSVARAAEACGFSTTALYRRRVKERDFAEAWDAAMTLGRARLEGLLVEAAQRQFDPEALPIAGEAPRVTTREAIEIWKYGAAKGSGAGSGAGSGSRGRGWIEPEVSEEEVAAARARIEARLDRMRENMLRAGYSETPEGHLIPPGYGKIG